MNTTMDKSLADAIQESSGKLASKRVCKVCSGKSGKESCGVCGGTGVEPVKSHTDLVSVKK